MLKKMKSWASLSKKVSRPKRARKFQQLLSGTSKTEADSPLLWAVNRVVKTGDAARTIARWHHAIAKQRKLNTTAREVINTVSRLSAGASSGLQSEAETALLALAAAQAMPAIATKCDEAQWRSALEHLMTWAESAQGNRDLMPWIYQLVAVELPLTLALLLNEFDDLKQTSRESSERMSDSISATLDLDGWPAARYLPVFAPLAASWTRCLLMIRDQDISFDPAAEEQLAWLVPQMFRLMRRDGTLMLSGFESTPIDRVFASRLVKIMNCKRSERRFAKVSRASKPKQESVDAIALQESSLSEWASSGIFQSQWTRRSPKLAIDFSDRQCQLEIGRDVSLIAGNTLPTISFDGQALQPESDFEISAHEQNDKVDFIELAMTWSNGLNLQRQIVLSRQEEFLIVADVVLPETPGAIDYQCHWPLAPGVEAMRETETREIYLTSGKIQSLVLPLALPEWKNERSPHRLEVSDGQLVLAQQAQAAALYAPLFFDLNPKRSTRQRTWRQLTVAEILEIVSPDVASAFRVQVGKQQWILYRALQRNGNRTFIGENFSGEFFVGIFDKTGKVTPLLQIE